MTYSFILTEKHDKAGLVRFNRPEALNAFNRGLMEELVQALEDFDRDDSIGAMVITGSDRVFAAGADIKEMAEASAIDMMLADKLGIWDRLRAIKKPLIAAVSGWCLGGGNEVAMMCDMIIASETAKFGQPEINLGVIPGSGGTQRLAKTVGKAIAMEMVINNRTLSAKEAYRFGLINRIVPVEVYLEDALKLANEIGARAPLAVRSGKEMVNQAFETFLEEGAADERRAFYFLFSSEDQKEGMRAFIERRDPEWKGR